MNGFLTTPRTCLLLATLAFLLSPLLAVAGEDDWEHITESEGVQLYQRDAQKVDGIAFRGIIETDLHIGQVIAVMLDAEERTHWVYRQAEAEALEEGEPNQRWSERYWVRVDMPFPATDRDYIFHTEYELRSEDRTVIADLESVEDSRKPEQDCCVRAQSYTHYTVEALPGEERTRITLEVEVDLGGRLPGWITRGARRDWPVETLTALVERAREADVYPDVADWHD